VLWNNILPDFFADVAKELQKMGQRGFAVLLQQGSEELLNFFFGSEGLQSELLNLCFSSEGL